MSILHDILHEIFTYRKVKSVNSFFTYNVYNVPIGLVGIIASTSGITNCLIDTHHDNLYRRMSTFINIAESSKLDSDYIHKSIDKYFDGDPTHISKIPIDIPDTSPPFFKKIWEACRTIPIGETRSYGWLAKQAGNEKAVRAAGQAMKNNKLPLFVPCHRVILSNRNLGNYTSGGTKMKQFLLNLESGGAYV